VRKLLTSVVVGLLLGALAPAHAQQAQSPSLPPISFSCPMDPDVIADRAGTCPRCGMTLAPVRLDTAYSCPLHPAIIETTQGACPICRRPLVAVTVSLFWTCAGHPAVHALTPGACEDGRPRVAARERRAHGDHNPRHGGQFFMAPDNWHHVEGTYPRAGIFRLFLYNDFTRPIALKGIIARAITSENVNPASSREDERMAIALTVAGNGRYLEGHVPLALPAQIAVKVRFGADNPEHRFDFLFPDYTKEPSATMPAVTAPPGAARPESAATESAAETTTTMIAELRSDNQRVQTLLAQGALAELYLPALAAKDAGLALGARANALPPDSRAVADAALKRLVLAAWQIDRYGDLGDRRRLDEACRIFSDAVVVLTKAYDAIH
jgi:hypothetical protein